MKIRILFILFTCFTSYSFAQIHEVGVFLGGSNFIGDIGRANYVYPNKIAGGLVYKYNLNPRIALRGNYNYIGLSGDNKNRESIENNSVKTRNFSNSIHEFAAGIEFNFFDYNIQKRETSFTPYILAQLAAFNYKSPVSYEEATSTLTTKSTFSYTAPVGIGIKGRLTDNIAFALESAIRFTLKDDLDFSTDKIKELNFGGNGNDNYVFTGFSLVYTFGRPPCYAYLEE